MRQPRLVWHCERQYRPVACGAVHINRGVRCRNDGVAAGLYSQTGVVGAKRIACIVDGYIVDRGEPMSALPEVTPVLLAALTALKLPAPAGIPTLTPDCSCRLMGLAKPLRRRVVSTLMPPG